MNAAQTQALAQLRKYIRGFLSGSTVPQLDWAGELASTRVDYNGEEVKTAQLVTWRQLEPALPPPGKAGCVRASDLLEGWARACMEDPTKTLLPEDKWPDELPQPQVWVESQKDWHEICSGAAERGIFTFLKEQDVFHFQGKPLLNGLFGVEKKNKSLDSGEPVLRMIINAIPATALQETIEADVRTLPYFGQWSAISVDEEDRVVVWNELDMTPAFYVFRLEPAWYKCQALAKPVSGQFASRWVPKLWAEESVYPAVAVMAMGWKSSCGLLQQIHRKLCFLPKPMGEGLDPSREVRRDGPVPRSGRLLQRVFAWVQPRRTQALESAQSSREVELGSRSSTRGLGPLGSPVPDGESNRQRIGAGLETLGCRIDGNAGVIAPPRSVVSRLIGLTAWFARNPTQRRHTAEILGGRWVRCFQVRKLFVHYWDWLHSQGSVSRGRAIIVPRGVLEDLLLALCHLPLMFFDLRLRTSPLVVVSDASATGPGVCRTSSLEPKGLLALAALQEGHNFGGEEIGLIEVGTTPGGVRHAFARLKIKPGAYAIVSARDESKRIIQQTWPDAMVSDASTELTETEITDLMNRAPRSDKWLVAGAEHEPSSIWTAVTLIQKIAASLHRAMPEYSVETLFESRNNLSNTARVSVSCTR